MNESLKLNYEVNPSTLAIIAKELDGRHVAWIMEDGEDADYYVRQSPRKIMDVTCRFFGSSLKGRQDGTKDVCGISHKAPISIDSSSGMYFFPTTSPNNVNCSWIAHSHLDRINKLPEHFTELVFKNGRTVILKVSYGSMINQIQRTAQFRYLLDKRIKDLLRNRSDFVAEPFM
ncbi:competence protein ComK [Aquibacillus kalidii]|uniref:competence protein ComK n=1 Tax=Aquibacillus kalidii TaxID=2762597 RepID=UPI001644818B|nr:competence protein ComK [Aquibacillus kalidii]